ncbi:hypothetical protein BJX96DRAFT_159945 [Aspergillus floccosus]
MKIGSLLYVRVSSNNGFKLIHYISAGSYESWRDGGEYEGSHLGQVLNSWPDIRWADARSGNIQSILISRLDKAQCIGCNGVDPNNVNDFENESAFLLTQQDSIIVVSCLAHESHSGGI